MKRRMGLKCGTIVNEPKEPKPIRKRSDKMKQQMKEYKPKVAAYLAKHENQICLIQSPVCRKKATCINHRRRRGANLLNEEDWEPSCTPCNLYIETHDAWARENGHLLSVHKNDSDSID